MVKYGQYDVPSSDIMINLGVGQPRNDILKCRVEDMKTKFLQLINEDLPDEILQYGDIPGYKKFRESLSSFLNNYNYNSNYDNFFQTNGATEAVQIMASLLDKDDIVIVENPTYFLMINIFKEMGLNIKYVNMEIDGFCVEDLENILNTYPDKNILFYSIPFNHNPTGINLSDEKKQKLVKLCLKFKNLKVITDEVYQLLNFYSESNIPMAEYNENIITIGSFSKVIAPAFRIGWIYSKNINILNTLKDLGIRDSSGGNNLMGSIVVEKMLESNTVHNYILSERMRLSNNLNLDNLENIEKYFEFIKPSGGYFLWLKLKPEFNYLKEKFNEINFKKYRVKFHVGSKFSINKDFSDCIRISLSYYEKKDIDIGLERIINLCEDLNTIDIYGWNGKLGKLICQELDNKKINFLKCDRNLKITSNIVIDVTSKEGTEKLLKHLLKINFYPSLIIGTTGHDNFNLMEEYGKKGKIFYFSNFSNGVRMVKQLCHELNKNDLKDYNVKIEEYHHINKKDKPSGTAKTLSNLMNGLEIESYREGDIYGIHKIIIKNNDEEIVISHKAQNRELFSKGCVNFIEKINDYSNGFYMF